MPLQEAIEALRPHHQWQPDTLRFDRAPPPEVASTLAARGHKISDRKGTGIVNAIMRTPDGWVGAADPRKGGTAAGQ
jgi:gamma-glutamyltranspeptidase/glutathione hydrolase